VCSFFNFSSNSQCQNKLISISNLKQLEKIKLKGLSENEDIRQFIQRKLNSKESGGYSNDLSQKKLNISIISV
jgi:hypothetical protein